MWNPCDFRNYRAIYLGKEIGMNTPIMRYTSLRTLKQIMHGKLYVRKRKCYVDPHEKGKYVERAFACPFEFMSRLNQAERTTKELESENLDKNIEKSYNTLTSCWTYSHGEKQKMWDDGEGRDILIKSTVGQLLAAINTTDFDTIVCDKMRYQTREVTKVSLHDFIFIKEGSEFEVEEELRFYFFSSKEIEEDTYFLPLSNKGLFFNSIVTRKLSGEKLSQKEQLIKDYPILSNYFTKSSLY